GILFSLALALPSFADGRFQREFGLVQGGDSLSFVWASDLHYRSRILYNYGITPAGLRAIVRETCLSGADVLALTGDLVHGFDPADRLTRDLGEIRSILAECSVPVLALMGNHDDGSYYLKSGRPGDMLTERDFFGALGMPQYARGYYFADFPRSRIRVICLNSSDTPRQKLPDGSYEHYPIDYYSFGQEQLRWLALEALRMEKGWAAVILTHTDTRHISPTAEQSGFDTACAILDAFGAGARVTLGEDTEADFGGYPSRELIGVFAGHVHKKQIKTADGVLHIIQGCAFGRYPVFSGVTVNRSERRIFITDSKGNTDTVNF
ncbi:MAG: metallophosphoesterase, partial [Abditibacteriota bacterium]|nr:metallophosphoesterase [Abditibacteriota bacterium]